MPVRFELTHFQVALTIMLLGSEFRRIIVLSPVAEALLERTGRDMKNADGIPDVAQQLLAA